MWPALSSPDRYSPAPWDIAQYRQASATSETLGQLAWELPVAQQVGETRAVDEALTGPGS